MHFPYQVNFGAIFSKSLYWQNHKRRLFYKHLLCICQYRMPTICIVIFSTCCSSTFPTYPSGPSDESMCSLYLLLYLAPGYYITRSAVYPLSLAHTAQCWQFCIISSVVLFILAMVFTSIQMTKVFFVYANITSNFHFTRSVNFQGLRHHIIRNQSKIDTY